MYITIFNYDSFDRAVVNIPVKEISDISSYRIVLKNGIVYDDFSYDGTYSEALETYCNYKRKEA